MKLPFTRLHIHVGRDHAPRWADELEGRIQKELRHMAKTLEDTLALVRAQKTQTESLIALTGSIKARLDAITSGALTPDQQAAVDAIFSEVETEQTEVATALTENTPAEGTPVDEPGTPAS